MQKKTICVLLLSLILVLSLLSGCTKAPQTTEQGTTAVPAPADTGAGTEPEETTDPTEPPVTIHRPGVFPVEDIHLQEHERFWESAFGDGELLVVTTDFDNVVSKMKSRFFFLDTATGEVREKAKYADKQYLTDPVLTEEEVILQDGYNGIAKAYRRDGSFVEEREIHVVWGDQLPQTQPGPDGCALVEYDPFSPSEDFMVRSFLPGEDDETLRCIYDMYLFLAEPAFVFGDDPEAVWRVKDCPGGYVCRQGHRILMAQEETEEGVPVVLLDLDKGTANTVCVHRPRWKPAFRMNEQISSLGEDAALLAFSLSDEYFGAAELYLWYPDPAEERPITVERMTREDLEAETAAEVARLEERYGIRFHVDWAEGDRLDLGGEACDLHTDFYRKNLIVRELGCFLDQLPENFVRELFMDLDNRQPDRSGLEISVVRQIPGPIAAYADGWADPLRVTFEAVDYSPSTIVHEFMHLMDLRLNAYMAAQGRDWDAAWSALSPRGSYGGKKLDKENFVTGYAMTNGEEDRADTFRVLWFSDGPLSEQDWYKDSPGVQKKVRLLMDTIRAAFPSVQAVGSAPWEHPE